LLTSEFAREAAPSTAYKNVLDYWEHSSGEMLQRLLYTDIKTYLVELLMKQDNMSMAASIESRVPFLDHVLVEFATRIPREVQIQGMAGKRILKKAVEDLLPHSILYRQKLGFPTPWSGWLAGPRLEAIREMLLEPRSLNRGYFRREASRSCSTNIARSIATTTIASGVCSILSCGIGFVWKAKRTTKSASRR
jgi:asparagine synthetase B (glutamine-hydrolysing)